MTEQLINRRKTLKYLGLLTATAAGREFLSEWFSTKSRTIAASEPDAMAGMHHGVPPDPDEGKPYVPQFFNPAEFATVEILTEMIIPADDKPGAKDAQVGRYIDFIVFSAAEFEPALQRRWTDGLAWLNGECHKRWKKDFQEIAPADREHLMMDMSLPERESTLRQDHPGFSFYSLIKEMTVEGFYTSRIGLVQVLEYQGLDYLTEFAGCVHPEHQK
ncbi:MAG TPA: gluconate 2-dehydrogenase subunit 3 family protein [Terriglobia bacterium]|nr:gluconate 2-dehydrogenase subunit 3 family protein [Terriglobia bacterium]